MAQFQHLPIYRSSYQLLLEASLAIKSFPREYKYTLGQKMREEIIEVIVLVFKANSTKRKKDILDDLISRIQVASLLFRLCHDMKILPLKRYVALSAISDSIGKQATGWKKSAVNFGVGADEPESQA